MPKYTLSELEAMTSSELEEITTLDLTFGDSQIPEIVSRMDNLESLSLACSPMGDFSLKFPSKLKHLCLLGCKLTVIPHDIFDLVYLEKLNLSDNFITYVSSAIG